MNSAYFLRFILLSLASFFLLHLLLGICVRLLTPFLLRYAGRLRPRTASDLLLAMRLAPATIAAAAVGALAAPSYLRYEPNSSEESIGATLYLLAALGAFVCIQSLIRTARALRYAAAPIHQAPVLRLTGIITPRVVVSAGVRAALSEEQWQAVLRHEHAHMVSLDNLKRLLMLLAPQLTPLDRGWQPLESAWVHMTERAADASAVDGDPNRALVLAEALVRLARLGLDRNAGALASSFATHPEQLHERVQCLLHQPLHTARRAWILPASAFALAAFLAISQAWLHSIHLMLEMLVD